MITIYGAGDDLIEAAPGLATRPREQREQYARFAAEVAKRLGQVWGRTDG